MVGRDDERAHLHAVYDVVGRGTSSTVLVAGEAGVGKSTLIKAVCADLDAAVLTGGCVPVAGQAMPFAPVFAALRDFSRRWSDDERAAMVAGVPSEFARVLGWDTPRTREAPAVLTLDAPLSGSAQVRLFESLLAVLHDLARLRPVVWVVEDLHWADRSTLDLIAFLARNLQTERVLVVLTLRSDDIPAWEGLQPWLAELVRLRATSRLTLERLGRFATEQQLVGLLPDTRATVPVVDEIFAHSAGNPLFTEQLSSWMSEGGRVIPDTLRELVAAKYVALPPTVRDVLEIAAVVGEECTLELLARVADAPEPEVEPALRSAVEQFVMRVGPGETFTFAHPLFREVLLADLMPWRHRRLHAEVARHLTEQPGGSVAHTLERSGQIADHWEAAGAEARALEAAVAAGQAALEVCAFAEADRYLTRAVRLIHTVDEVDTPLPAERLDVVVGAAQAAHLTGDGSRAVALAREAAELATPEPRRRAEILERMGAYAFNAGLVDEAETSYREALELLPVEPSTARARVHAGLGMLAMAWSRLDDAEASCTEAIRIARIVGTRQEEGRALNALGVVTAYHGDFDRGIGFSRESVAIAEALTDPDDLAAAYIDLTHVLGVAGRYDEAVAACRAGYRAMRRVGLVRQDGSFLQANAADALIKTGRWPEATKLLDDAVRQQPQGVRGFPVLLHTGRLTLGTGDLSAARAATDQARSLLDEYPAPDSWRRELDELEAELLLWEGRPADAMAAADEGLRLTEGGDEGLFAGPLVVLYVRAAAQLLELARAGQHTLVVRRIESDLELLLCRARSLPVDPTRGDDHRLVDGPAVALSIAAELSRCRRTSSAVEWADVAEAWAALRQPFQVAYARWREAEVAVVGKASGSVTTAAVRRAHVAAVVLGAGALQAEVEQLGRWARVEVIASSDRTETAVPTPQGEATGLTPRELEVLAGLVAGRSNGEIAVALFISVKTASVHVSNILRKLGVSSRGEAARIAHRWGVAPAE